jgi:hypothetical protein
MLPSEQAIFLIATNLIDENKLITLEDLYLYTQMKVDVVNNFLNFCYEKNFINEITYNNLENLKDNYKRIFKVKINTYGEIKTFENRFYKFNDIAIQYFSNKIKEVNQNPKKLNIKLSPVKNGSMIATLITIFIFISSFGAFIDTANSSFDCTQISNYNPIIINQCLFSKERKEWESKKSESLETLTYTMGISLILGFISSFIYLSTKE